MAAEVIQAGDPGFDVLVGWDDSLGFYKNLLLADILTEGSPAAGDFLLAYAAEGDLRKINWSSLPSPGGSNTQVQFNDNSTFGGDSAFTWDKTNDGLYVGSGTNANVDGQRAALQIDNDLLSRWFDTRVQYGNDADPGVSIFAKTRGASPSTLGLVSADDVLGAIRFYGNDGTNGYIRAAHISVEVDGTSASNDMPGRIVFATTADGAAAATERLRIKSNGTWGVNNNAQGITWSDAGFDVVFGWDDSAGTYKSLLLADILTEGAPASGDFLLLYGAEGDLRKVNWSSLPGAGGGISNVVEDTTPELGGDLESNNFDIKLEQFSADAVSADLYFQKSRNAAIGSHTVVQSGDDLGRILFQGSDGTNFETGAMIMAEVDDTPGDNDMPGRLTFWTTPNASATAAERARIDNAGSFLLNATTSSFQGFGTRFLVADNGNMWHSRFAIYGSHAGGAELQFTKTRHASDPNTHTVLQDGDLIGDLHFWGSDGDEWMTSAQMKVVVDGTPANNIVPAKIQFWSQIASGEQAVRMTIGALGNVGIGDTTVARRLSVLDNNTATNTVTQVARLWSATSNTPAAGIGAGLEFVTETAADNHEIGATIEAVTTDVGSGTEDFDLVFRAMAGGAAAAERFRVLSVAGEISVNSIKHTASDAGFDVVYGWDDSAGTYKSLLLADIATEASPASGDFVLIYGAEGDLRKANWSTLPGGGGSQTPWGSDIDTADFDLITAGEALTIKEDDASTDTVRPILNLRRTSSGGAGANGIGASLTFEVECAATTEVGASIAAVTTDVTDTSEDFDLSFRLMAAGAAAAEKFRMNGTSFIFPGSDSTSVFALRGNSFATTGINVNSSGHVVIGGDGAGKSVTVTDELRVHKGAIRFEAAADEIQSRWHQVGVNNTSGIIEQRFATLPQTYRMYRTFTDTSNYERLALQTGSGFVELAAETAGSGTDNVDVRLSPAGTGSVFPQKRILDGATTLTDGATPALDASLGNVFKLVAAGNRTIAVPSNKPASGQSQKIIIMHEASGADRTLALTTGSAGAFRFGTDVTALTATTSGLVDYIGCVFNQVDDRWDVVSYSKGY